MNKKIYLIIIAFLLTASSIGCGQLFTSSYPKDQIPEDIQRLCKQEYGIDEKIDAKIVGKTLGVRIHFDELLTIDLKLQEEALDKLQKLLRILRRICLSTDADLDFFVIVGYEKKLGFEVVFYSYIDDLKRARAGWMSPDDYFQRLIKTMRMDTLRWGENRINKLLKDIASGDMIKVIVNNFATGTKLSDLSPRFLQVLIDLGKKNYIRWQIITSRSVPVSSQERLYYIEAREHFTPKIKDVDNLQYPSGTIHNFYMLVSVEDLNPIIKNIYTAETLPHQFRTLGAAEMWDKNDFFVEDFIFHKFLSTQIIQRIQFEVSQDNQAEEKDKKNPFTLDGDFIVKDKISGAAMLADPSGNIYKITISPNKGTTSPVPQELMDLALKTIKDVCDKYKFYDLGEIQLLDNKGNVLLSIDKPTLFSSH